MDDPVVRALENALDAYKKGDVDCIAVVAASCGINSIALSGNTAMLAGLIGAVGQKLKEDNRKVLFEVPC